MNSPTIGSRNHSPQMVVIGGSLPFAAVELFDLARHQEHRDRRDEQADQQVADSSDPGAGVLLQLVAVLVRPHERPEPERDDRQQDHDERRARLADGSGSRRDRVRRRRRNVRAARGWWRRGRTAMTWRSAAGRAARPAARVAVGARRSSRDRRPAAAMLVPMTGPKVEIDPSALGFDAERLARIDRHFARVRRRQEAAGMARRGQPARSGGPLVDLRACATSTPAFPSRPTRSCGCSR